MKKLLFLLALSFALTISAQDKITEGVVISKQTMTSDNDQLNGQLAMMGDMQTTTYFKDYKSRSELSNPMSGDVTTITDTKSKQTLMLMDNPMLGKKYMLQKAEDFDEAINNSEVVEGDETKTILGYDCKEYKVKMKKDGMEVEMKMFVTDAILADSQQTALLGDKLKGFPLYTVLEMSQVGSKMIITTEVIEIKKESVADDVFSLTPPEGYEKMQGQ
jgi:hypothetical protein